MPTTCDRKATLYSIAARRLAFHSARRKVSLTLRAETLVQMVDIDGGHTFAPCWWMGRQGDRWTKDAKRQPVCLSTTCLPSHTPQQQPQTRDLWLAHQTKSHCPKFRTHQKIRRPCRLAENRDDISKCTRRRPCLTVGSARQYSATLSIVVLTLNEPASLLKRRDSRRAANACAHEL